MFEDRDVDRPQHTSRRTWTVEADENHSPSPLAGIFNIEAAVQSEGEEEADTLKTYIGNNTWAEDNDRIIITNNEYRYVTPSAYYILKKEIE